MNRPSAGMLLVCFIVTVIAGCGGSGSSDGGGGGTTPTATSTKSVEATAALMAFSMTAYQEILVAIGGGAGAMAVHGKAGGLSYTCDVAAASGYLCVGNDLQGGSCTISMSGLNQVTSITFSYDCTTFHVDSNTTIDGSFTVVITPYNAPAAMAADASAPGQAIAAKVNSSAECTTQDDSSSFDDGLCTQGGTCTSSSANLVAIETFTVGSDGLVITDACGTFTYGAGLTMETDICYDATTVTYSYSINGTFNGEAANSSGTWTCQYLL